MFETTIVVVGNVLTAPEWRRTSNSGQLVTNFRIASTARRYDRDTGRWVDGNSLRVRVTAWRKPAEGVGSSVKVGDPVIVYGRLYTRDWVDDDKNNRVSYEMEAFSIGHDLGRGRARFFRNRPVPGTSTVEGPDADTIVRGEPSVLLGEEETPVAYGDGMPERLPDEEAPEFLEATPAPDQPGTDDGEEIAIAVEPLPEENRRTRRGVRREPVPA